MYRILLLLVFLTNIFCLCKTEDDVETFYKEDFLKRNTIQSSNTNPVTLTITRDIDYSTLPSQSHIDDIPVSPNQSFNFTDNDNTTSTSRTHTAFRMTFPFGQKRLIKALKISPTVVIRYNSNNSLFEITDISKYLRQNMKIDVEIHRSCRKFSSTHKNHTNYTTYWYDAVNDFSDDIGSLAFPCKLNDFYEVNNTNLTIDDIVVYKKTDIFFQIQSKKRVHWSYVYDINIFLSINTDLSDGFQVDTTNVTHQLDLIYNRFLGVRRIENFFTEPLLTTEPVDRSVHRTSWSTPILEPHAYWVVINIRSDPYISLYDIYGTIGNMTNNSIIYDKILSQYIQIPIWSIDDQLLNAYKSTNNTLDNLYTLQNNIDLNKYIINVHNMSFKPFFLSYKYCDINSQSVSTIDYYNYYQVNATEWQVRSEYNKLLYNNTGNQQCYKEDRPSLEMNMTTLFDTSSIYSIVSVPTMAYKIYTINTFDSTNGVNYPWKSIYDILLTNKSNITDTTTTTIISTTSGTSFQTSTSYETTTSITTSITTGTITQQTPTKTPPTSVDINEPDSILDFFKNSTTTNINYTDKINNLEQRIQFWYEFVVALCILIVLLIIFIIIYVRIYDISNSNDNNVKKIITDDDDVLEMSEIKTTNNSQSCFQFLTRKKTQVYQLQSIDHDDSTTDIKPIENSSLDDGSSSEESLGNTDSYFHVIQETVINALRTNTKHNND